MRDLWNRILEFREVSAMFGGSILFIIVGWGWAIVALHAITPTIVLHWTTEDGLSRINQIILTKDIPAYLSLIGGSALCMILINGWIALAFAERHWFWGKFMAGATLLISILIFIGFLAIIRVN